MTIRTARPADALSIALVHLKSWRTTYWGILPDDFLRCLRLEPREHFWAARLRMQEPRECVVVAEDASKGVIGFASAGPQREDIFGYQGELYAIYLLAEHQQQGVGRALFKAVSSELVSRNFDSMMLWVLEANPACKFYQAMGGTPFTTKRVSFGGMEFTEVAYGWKELRAA